ncbi:MAG: hypothetical protein AB8I08_37910, partial [Sandaracinaceae bacterium]
VVVYSLSGTHLRDRSYGSEGSQSLSALAAGPGGSLTLGGLSFGVVDFGSGIRSSGTLSGYVARIAD